MDEFLCRRRLTKRKANPDYRLDAFDEKQLLEACRQGDSDAFRVLFDRYHKRVLQVAYRLCGNLQEAEDTTQEVFLRVYQAASEFEGISELFTWLYRITTNLSLDRLRKRERRRKYQAPADLTLPEWSDSAPPSPEAHEEAVWEQELQQKLQEALNQLKPKWRIVLVLKDIEGLSYRDIARIIGCSEGTVSSRLNRGRQQLRAILGKMGIDRTYLRRD